MSIYKQVSRTLLFITVGLILIITNSMSVKAALDLTKEEKNYIEKNNIIKSVSTEKSAPLQYTDKKGEIRGISIRILEEISDMTGLTFKYKLYNSIDEVFGSDYDLVFTATPRYAPEEMLLSPPYLKTEAILYVNSSLDSNNLENKKYAAIEGGSLPEGIKEEDTKYYRTREDSLNAVEAGEADYGYGNAYSVAFYTLQNSYKNIVTIPRGKEPREYSMGVDKENAILMSIINKSLKEIDESQIQTLILDETSHIDRKITFSMIMDTYGNEIIIVSILIMTILLLNVASNIRAKNKLRLQNKRYELLSHISNEYLYNYYVDEDYLELSEKCTQLFGTKEKFSEAIRILKKELVNGDLEGNIEQISLTLISGDTAIFKAVNSKIFDDKGRLHSIIGKLTDISDEVAERKKLIINAQIDGLTGLYNSTTAKKLIDKNIKNSDKDPNKKDALVIIDFDKFKDINDTFGHLAGDEVLKLLSRVLKTSFTGSDIIGRIGGDEFCVYIKNICSIDDVRLKCQQVNTFIREENKEFYISISAGIALLNEEKTYEELFKRADIAMYKAKEKGRGKIYFKEG